MLLLNDILHTSRSPIQFLDWNRFHHIILLFRVKKLINSGKCERHTMVHLIMLHLLANFVGTPRLVNLRYQPLLVLDAMKKAVLDCFRRAGLPLCHSPTHGGENINDIDWPSAAADFVKDTKQKIAAVPVLDPSNYADVQWLKFASHVER